MSNENSYFADNSAALDQFGTVPDAQADDGGISEILDQIKQNNEASSSVVSRNVMEGVVASAELDTTTESSVIHMDDFQQEVCKEQVATNIAPETYEAFSEESVVAGMDAVEDEYLESTTSGVEENKPEKNTDQADRDVSRANDMILDSIAMIRNANHTYAKARQELGLKIHRKQSRCRQLKESLGALVVAMPPEASREQELASQSNLVRTVNCKQIIECAEDIQRQIKDGNQPDLWRVGIGRIENAVDVLKTRMEYIELLKELGADMEEYKRLRKEEENNKIRFQNYRTLFS
ncbi:MAG: hypothetical protein CSB47_06865 [Proteobacteria bacterium]|nr:MAG: hypothetical protein CSB47_06865 [Pseudomonadota bacterium]